MIGTIYLFQMQNTPFELGFDSPRILSSDNILSIKRGGQLQIKFIYASSDKASRLIKGAIGQPI